MVERLTPSSRAMLAVSGGLDGTVRVWDLATGKEVAVLAGHDGRVAAVAVSADGSRTVTGDDGGTVRVWDLAAGRQLAVLAGHDRSMAVAAVAVSADGSRAVSGGWDRTVRVWDLAAGKEVARWTGDYAVIACTVLSSQPFKIAVGQQRGQPYLLELRGVSARSR